MTLYVLLGLALFAVFVFVYLQPPCYLLRHLGVVYQASWEWEKEIERRTVAIVRERGIPVKHQWCEWCECNHPHEESARTIAQREYLAQMKEAAS